MDNVIITGATSMMGVALIDQCIKHNIKVTALVRENSNNLYRIPKNDLITIVECNLNDLNNVRLSESFDVFYHFGWEFTYHEKRDDIDSQRINIKYSLDAVELAKRLNCKKFVGAGSQAEYGIKSEKISPNTQCNPISAYGKIKNEVSKITLEKCKEYGIIHIWVRIFSVYGIYENKRTMISQTINKLLNGEVPSFTPAEQEWDFLFSEDAGRAFYLVGKHSDENTIYCLGSGKTRRLHEYITVIRDTINPSISVKIGDIPYSENQVMYLCADISNLTKDTTFVPKYTFEEGIKKTIELFKR